MHRLEGIGSLQVTLNDLVRQVNLLVRRQERWEDHITLPRHAGLSLGRTQLGYSIEFTMYRKKLE